MIVISFDATVLKQMKNS